METFSALLAIYAGNSPVSGVFPAQRPVTRSFCVFFDLRPNKRLSKQLWSWWFEVHSPPLWRHNNGGKANDCIEYGFMASRVNSVLLDGRRIDGQAGRAYQDNTAWDEGCGPL